MGILFALLSAFTIGLSNILLKRSYKDFSPTVSQFFFSLFSLVLWITLAFWLGIQWNNPILGVFVGLTSAVFANLIYIYVLSRGMLSTTSTILSGYSLFTILFSILFNHETVSFAVGIFLAFAIGGTLIVAFPEKGNFKKDDLKRLDGILWALFAAMTIGISDTLSKWYIQQTSVGSILFYTACTQLLVSIFYMNYKGEKFSQFKNIFKQLREYSFPLWGSFLTAFGTGCIYIALNFTNASIASPIMASYPVLTVVLAFIFLKEKISLKNWIGLVFLFVAVIGIGFVHG